MIIEICNQCDGSGVIQYISYWGVYSALFVAAFVWFFMMRPLDWLFDVHRLYVDYGWPVKLTRGWGKCTHAD